MMFSLDSLDKERLERVWTLPSQVASDFEEMEEK